ncbi:hypothetical protein [Streptomyces sp. L2]|uniref:hypothetical protein n=1 Tax=Streptomyces sp. L2 TaxID=2162665 RepID=UPI00101370B5|nr:hypothetical protein [Streptomyces sp. L2]
MEQAADTNCGGALNSAALIAAQRLVGSQSFTTSTIKGGTAGTARRIIAEYRTHGVTGTQRSGLCWIYGSKKDLSDLTISFSLSQDVPQSHDVASKFTPYRLGSLALTSAQRAVIYLKCSSTKFESDSDRQTFILRGEVNNRYTPDGAPTEAQRNNLVVMYSASLALVKTLVCANDAGLPDKFGMPVQESY